VAGAEQRKARLANAVLANGSDNRVVVVERRIRTLSPSLSLACHCVSVITARCTITH